MFMFYNNSSSFNLFLFYKKTYHRFSSSTEQSLIFSTGLNFFNLHFDFHFIWDMLYNIVRFLTDIEKILNLLLCQMSMFSHFLHSLISFDWNFHFFSSFSPVLLLSLLKTLHGFFNSDSRFGFQLETCISL